MLGKILLYWNTVRYMKPSQIYYRLRKMARLSCTLGVMPKKTYDDVLPIHTIPELDFDPVFLARFPVEKLMADKVTLLYESENFHWDGRWSFPNRTPLWNYNLHYFEYLFPLVKAYKDTGDGQYFDKVKGIIQAWIRQNPRQNGEVGWDPYPTALRLTNWLSVYAHLKQEFDEDEDFHNSFVDSIWNQYDCLAHHLEKDLLGNHYFEDLKALILCAIFFNDEKMLTKALAEFQKQCHEQILPDGMHFELSPMYHKIILEDVMHVAAALRGAGKKDVEIESCLQPMLDAAYSLEEGLERIPLFNDCGNNVAKSLDALCKAAKNHFDLKPEYKDRFPDSGYYIFKKRNMKLIVDAGQPGPSYLPAHAHCDAMSFELFKDGKPVIVNCGTYAYQCEERAFFRSTAAHNTVQVEEMEQSQCWGVFRMGKRSRTVVKRVSENEISMEMKDQKGKIIARRILWNDDIHISDFTRRGIMRGYLHVFTHFDTRKIISKEIQEIKEYSYADEFGEIKKIKGIQFLGSKKINTRIILRE